MNLASWLERVARQSPGRPALFLGADPVATYREWAGRAADIAADLRWRRGLEPGDRVALFMVNHPAYFEWLFGIWWAGCVAVPINAKLHAAEAAWIVGDSGARLVVASGENLRDLADHGDIAAVAPESVASDGGGSMPTPAPREMEDLAWLFYTSGTTGRPKGVMLTNANLVAASASYAVDVDAVMPDDASLYAAPVSHGAGLYSLVHVARGCRHVFPLSGGFEPREVLDLARTLGEVTFFAAPTMVRRLTDHARLSGESGEGIKTIVYGGGPMYQADIADALETFGQRFVQIYGQGESPMTITVLSRQHHEDATHPNHARRLASVGVAHSVVSVRVTGIDGEPLPPHRHGEVEVKGLTVMRGYWGNREATDAAIVDGWLRTGDIGFLDEDGFLTLTDRSKDVIISGGTNIYPREVEEVLLTHPAVREVSVVGAPDPDWGEVVVACVVIDPAHAADDEALDAHCLRHMARFKRPKRYLRLEQLPKNNYGKIVKTGVREMLKRGAG